MQSFTATRDLSADEAAIDGALADAKRAAFKEALAAAISANGSADLPQDHGIDEADHRLGDGGHHVEVIVTLPE